MSELVEARLTLRIPRDARGDVQEAAGRRLRRTGVVDRVESFDVTGVRPGLNDLKLRVETTVACDVDSASEATAALASAVGIEAVDTELVESSASASGEGEAGTETGSESEP
ncbi:hypothetical protein [Salinigranum sp. GCM10025319]|uniref:hypothetical protein n=1 Tax=Salinigranum sp. GCM10025319 TaxID=3252687 RepID=UPI00361F5A41